MSSQRCSEPPPHNRHKDTHADRCREYLQQSRCGDSNPVGSDEEAKQRGKNEKWYSVFEFLHGVRVCAESGETEMKGKNEIMTSVCGRGRE